ncbi:hypothetical protein [Thermodesulfitimonas sp.]
MDEEKVQRKEQKSINAKGPEAKAEFISYRLKCVKTANGLSHFVMYGDVPKEKSPL